MNKFLSFLLILSLIVFVLGCTTLKTDSGDDSSLDETGDSTSNNVDDLQQELDGAEEDLGLEDFDELDQELNDLDDLENS